MAKATNKYSPELRERADQRTTWPNGYRERALDTWLGTLNLKVP